MSLFIKQDQHSFSLNTLLRSPLFWLGIILLFLFVNIYGYFFIFKKIVLEQDVHTPRQMIQTHAHIIPNWIKGRFAQPEKLELHIKHVDMQRIRFKRDEALEKGILINTDEDYVPAQIHYDGEYYDAEIRLKGDWLDHLRGKKWSYRVKMKKDDTVFGMKVFSLQHPKTRNYLYEWVHQKAMALEGLITLRYKFIELSINGENFGIYALEEHFDKLLIEHNDRREAPILRFNEDLVWQNRIFNADQTDNGVDSFASSMVDTFRRSKTFASPALTDSYAYGVHLLESFRRGDIASSEVFDMEQMPLFMAITDIFGSPHGTIWHNLRFYINPMTQRLEPIIFDNFSGVPTKELAALRPVAFNERLFADPIFFAAYIEALEKLSQSSYLDALFETLNEDNALQKNLSIIYHEFPFHAFGRSVLEKNQAYVQQVLDAENALLSHILNNDKEGFTINMGNRHVFPIEISHISHENNTLYRFTNPVILPGKKEDDSISYTEVFIPQTIHTTSSSLSLHYRIPGSTQTYQTNVNHWSNTQPDIESNDITRKPVNMSDLETLFTIDHEEKILTPLSSFLNISKDTILPKEYILRIPSNSTIQFSNDAQLLSRGAIEANGTEAEPITFFAEDTSRSGMFVLSSDTTSTFTHTEFYNFSTIDQAPLLLKTGLMFYDTQFACDFCTFHSNQSGDDILNLFHTPFSIQHSLFKNSIADAFDADFSDGIIKNTQFIDIGNDAIDISGANVRIEDIYIENTGDKGISVGERSTLNGQNVSFVDTIIAVASKDDSSTQLSNISLSSSTMGFVSFQKKPEFDGAILSVEEARWDNVQYLYRVEEGSQLFINGTEREDYEEDIREELYGK